MNLNKTTIKRIASDVKYLLNNKEILQNENIYYKHSESNILKGYALIIGNNEYVASNGASSVFVYIILDVVMIALSL